MPGTQRPGTAARRASPTSASCSHRLRRGSVHQVLVPAMTGKWGWRKWRPCDSPGLRRLASASFQPAVTAQQRCRTFPQQHRFPSICHRCEYPRSPLIFVRRQAVEYHKLCPSPKLIAGLAVLPGEASIVSDVELALPSAMACRQPERGRRFRRALPRCSIAFTGCSMHFQASTWARVASKKRLASYFAASLAWRRRPLVADRPGGTTTATKRLLEQTPDQAMAAARNTSCD